MELMPYICSTAQLRVQSHHDDTYRTAFPNFYFMFTIIDHTHGTAVHALVCMLKLIVLLTVTHYCSQVNALLPWSLIRFLQLLVGTEGSKTLRGSWLGTCPAPKQFLAAPHDSHAAVSSEAERKLGGAAVTCMDVSPVCPQVR